MNRKKTVILIVIAFILMFVGVISGDIYFTQKTATYGNMDIPGQISWVIKMQPGIRDTVSNIEYGKFNSHAIKFVSAIFIITFLSIFFKRKYDSIWRRLTQWTAFMIARLGVLRVSGICPKVPRTAFGVFPFLNCQGCEMATGACPIGMIQYSLINKRLPLYMMGVLLLTGTILGRSLCGWLCPYGFIVEFLEKFLFIKKLKQKINIPQKAQLIKYVVLVFIFSAFIWVAPLFCIYICQAANIYGYLPLYLTTGLEAFKESLKGGIALNIFWFHMGSIAVFFIGIMALGGRWFCKYICPLGAFYGLFNYVSIIKVKHIDEKCNNCNACNRICPMEVDLAKKDFTNITGCIMCGKCTKVCHTKARVFTNSLKKESREENK